MRRGRLALAAIGGLVLSFLVFAALMIVTPEEDLESGQGELRWHRFQFEAAEYVFTQGSVAVVANDDPVPVNLFVTAPDGNETAFLVAPNTTAQIDLGEQGVYRLHGETYPWGLAQIEVRSANPVVRFFEDLF